MSDQFWKKCTFCKKVIHFSTKIWTCNVSTCNQKATSYVFCSVMCWDGHVPVYRHRDAWANESHSPSFKEFEKSVVLIAQTPTDQSDVLVIASKVKAFIRKTSGMNTSDSVITLLSNKVRKMCDHAIEKAKADSRQTLLDRDISK